MKLDGLRYRRCESCSFYAYMRPSESKCRECRSDCDDEYPGFKRASKLE